MSVFFTVLAPKVPDTWWATNQHSCDSYTRSGGAASRHLESHRPPSGRGRPPTASGRPPPLEKGAQGTGAWRPQPADLLGPGGNCGPVSRCHGPQTVKSPPPLTPRNQGQGRGLFSRDLLSQVSACGEEEKQKYTRRANPLHCAAPLTLCPQPHGLAKLVAGAGGGAVRRSDARKGRGSGGVSSDGPRATPRARRVGGKRRRARRSRESRSHERAFAPGCSHFLLRASGDQPRPLSGSALGSGAERTRDTHGQRCASP